MRKTPFLTLLLVLALLSACSDGSLERAQRAGSLRGGYAVEAPYAFLGQDGEPTGESPEIARRIARAIGVRRIEWRQYDFYALLPALEAGSIDFIAAGLFITPERRRSVAFSRPTFLARPALLVRRGNPENLHSYADLLARPGLRVAVLDGAVELEVLRDLGFPENRLLLVPDASSGRASVASGVTAALALSAPTISWMTLREPSAAVEAAAPFAPPPGTSPAQGGFAFRPGDRTLLRAWNAALEDFVGGPEHLALVAPFGFTAADIPGAGPLSGTRR